MSHLLELLIRATVLTTVGFAFLWLARNRAAESRVALLRWVLAALAVLPALWALGPRWAFDIPWMAKPEPIVIDPSLLFQTGALAPNLEATPVDLLPWIYFGIGLLVLVPALVGQFLIRRIWRNAAPLPWQIQDELIEALDTLGIVHNVEARMGALPSPMVFGVCQRHLLLPVDFEEWPAQHRHLALLHEAAHLRRFDCAWQHLAHGVRAVYWCHPLVWFLSRALKDETELAADERAVRSGAEAADYAAALVAIARTLQEPGRLVRSQGVTFMNHRQLDRRVRSVLHGRRRGFTLAGSIALAAAIMSGTYLAAGIAPQAPVGQVIIAEPAIAPSAVPAAQAQRVFERVITPQQATKRDKKAARAQASRLARTRAITGRTVPLEIAIVARPAQAPRSVPQGTIEVPVAPRTAPLPTMARTRAVTGTTRAPAAIEIGVSPVLAPTGRVAPQAATIRSVPAQIRGRNLDLFSLPATAERPLQTRSGMRVAPTISTNPITATVRLRGELTTTIAPRAGQPIENAIVGTPQGSDPYKGRETVASPAEGRAFSAVTVAGQPAQKANSNPFLSYSVLGGQKPTDAEVKKLLEHLRTSKAADDKQIKAYLEQVKKKHGSSKREEELLKVLLERARKQSNASFQLKLADPTYQRVNYKTKENGLLQIYQAPAGTAKAPLIRYYVAPKDAQKAAFSQLYKADVSKTWKYPAYDLAKSVYSVKLGEGQTHSLLFRGQAGKSIVVRINVNGKDQAITVTPDKNGSVNLAVDKAGNVVAKP